MFVCVFVLSQFKQQRTPAALCPLPRLLPSPRQLLATAVRKVRTDVGFSTVSSVSHPSLFSSFASFFSLIAFFFYFSSIHHSFINFLTASVSNSWYYSLTLYCSITLSLCLIVFNSSERTCDKEFIIRRAATNRVLNVLRHWVSKHSQVCVEKPLA